MIGDKQTHADGSFPQFEHVTCFCLSKMSVFIHALCSRVVNTRRARGRTWRTGRLQLQDELLSLHVEESDVSGVEGRHHVSRLAAHQVDRGRDSEL